MANRLNQFNPVTAGNDLLDGLGNFLVDDGGGGGLIDTTTVVGSSLNPSTFGNSVIFTATVTPASGVIVPTGTATFKDSAATIGTGALNGAGVGTMTTSILGVGSHSITAVYGGDGVYNGSTSSILTQIVNAGIGPPPPNPTILLGQACM